MTDAEPRHNPQHPHDPLAEDRAGLHRALKYVAVFCLAAGLGGLALASLIVALFDLSL